MPPKYLKTIYEKIYNLSKKYILFVEYYNPTPLEVEYRGNKNVLFKRDFCGEIMEIYPDLELVDYGFIYHNDNNFALDDMTYFLMKK